MASYELPFGADPDVDSDPPIITADVSERLAALNIIDRAVVRAEKRTIVSFFWHAQSKRWLMAAAAYYSTIDIELRMIARC